MEADMSDNPWWRDTPWRMVQTNLREIDMRDINADEYVRQLVDFGANVCMINAAGIISSYPTQLEYHYQSEYLTGDSLMQIVERCHENNIKVIGRMDFSKVRYPLYEKYPHWAYIGTNGDIVNYNGDVHVCFNSEYQQNYALSIMEEAVNLLNLDGIFLNMGGYNSFYDYSGNIYGDCTCENCKRRFREMFGEELPAEASRHMPEKYEQFKRETLWEYEARVYRSLKEIKPNICLANFTGQNDGFVRNEAGTYFRDNRANWCYEAGELTKLAHSYPGMLPSITSVDFIDISTRLFSVSEHQQKLRMAQNLAAGGSLDYYLIGRLDNHEDQSGFRPLSEMYHYLRRHESEYTGMTSDAEILLLKPSGLFFSSEGMLNDYYGWYKILAQHHLLFDAKHLSEHSRVDWSRYRVAILPDCTGLDDAVFQSARSFVENGGTLICSGRAFSTKEEWMGIQEVKRTENALRSCYFKKGGDESDGLEKRELLYLTGLYVYADYMEKTKKQMHFIPPHPFGPPERCYYAEVTDYPAVATTRHGAGHVVYLPWHPARLYQEHGHYPMGEWLYSLLQPYVRKVQDTLPPMIELTVHGNQHGDTLVHVVNHTGFFNGAYHAPLELPHLDVKVYLDKAPASAVSLTLGAPCPFEVKKDYILLHLEKVALFDAIILQYQKPNLP